jgi:8-oxo-dGTP pyrophosphatase MutT (NUDIX family)
MADRYKTARCILYRDDQFLLAVHNSFWRASDRRWGLPGGQIEWREPPHVAAIRELDEELNVKVADLLEIGAFSYKHAMHMVYAAPFAGEIRDYDDNELVEIGWFPEAGVADFKSQRRLHAGYELEAVQTLRGMLQAGNQPAGHLAVTRRARYNR